MAVQTNDLGGILREGGGTQGGGESDVRIPRALVSLIKLFTE